MALFAVLALSSIGAAEEPELQAIRVVGNSRVEQSAIRVRVRSQVGRPPDPAIIEQDVRSIYAMGFFEDVQASVEDVDGGRRWTFEATPPLSTYNPVVVAGPFVEQRKEAGGYEMRLYARRTLASVLTAARRRGWGR